MNPNFAKYFVQAISMRSRALEAERTEFTPEAILELKDARRDHLPDEIIRQKKIAEYISDYFRQAQRLCALIGPENKQAASLIEKLVIDRERINEIINLIRIVDRRMSHLNPVVREPTSPQGPMTPFEWIEHSRDSRQMRSVNPTLSMNGVNSSQPSTVRIEDESKADDGSDRIMEYLSAVREGKIATLSNMVSRLLAAKRAGLDSASVEAQTESLENKCENILRELDSIKVNVRDSDDGEMISAYKETREAVFDIRDALSVADEADDDFEDEVDSDYVEAMTLIKSLRK